MKNMFRILCVSVFVAAAATLLIPVPTSDAAPDPSVKKIVLACKQGWRGSAVGQYGGVSFGVSCNNGRAVERITGVSGSAYSVRMGVESDTVAIDCFFTGDSGKVNETCGPVRLMIR